MWRKKINKANTVTSPTPIESATPIPTAIFQNIFQSTKDAKDDISAYNSINYSLNNTLTEPLVTPTPTPVEEPKGKKNKNKNKKEKKTDNDNNNIKSKKNIQIAKRKTKQAFYSDL